MGNLRDFDPFNLPEGFDMDVENYERGFLVKELMEEGYLYQLFVLYNFYVQLRTLDVEGTIKECESLIPTKADMIRYGEFWKWN